MTILKSVSERVPENFELRRKQQVKALFRIHGRCLKFAVAFLDFYLNLLHFEVLLSFQEPTNETQKLAEPSATNIVNQQVT